MPAVLSRAAALGARGIRCRLGAAGAAWCGQLRPSPSWQLLSSSRCRSGLPDFRTQLGSQNTLRHRENLNNSDRQVWWIAAGVMGIFGAVWLLVPLYKMYCQATGQGQAVQGHREYSAPPEPNSAAAKRLITIDFAGTVHAALPWEFVPQQRRVVVGLGETALAFYRARNKSDRAIIGVSVYHMIPAEAGLYFNKIQCFCFDEQLINPNEEVDLPIFFFIDPLMAQDTRFDHIDHITLSYLFFESDSELPPEYEDFKRAVQSKQAPPVMDAPAPTPAAPAAAPAAPVAAAATAAAPVP